MWHPRVTAHSAAPAARPETGCAHGAHRQENHVNETPRSPAEEAQDPSTSPERLMELTERHPQLHGLLVDNPSCPDVARQWILATNPRVRAKHQPQQSAQSDLPQQTDQAEKTQRPDPAQQSDEPDHPATSGDPEDTADVLATRPIARTAPATPGPEDAASSSAETDDGPPTQAMGPADAPAPLRGEPVEGARAESAPADPYGQEPPTAPGGDPDAQSAWGLPPVADAPATAPVLPPIRPVQEHPAAAAAASSGTVRHVKSDRGVVPLGPAASAPSMPSPAQSASTQEPGYGYPAPAPTANYEEPAQAGAAYAGPDGPDEYDDADDHGDGDDSGRSRATWWACGGCLLLALIVALVAIFGLRSFFSGGDDESAQQTSTSSSAAKEPSEKPSASDDEKDKKTTEAKDKSPAPDDAKDLSRVVSPTGNITCSLDDDSVGCSLKDRSFGGDSEDCSSGPFSISVADKKADLECGTTFGGDSPTTLAYEQSAATGDSACRSESEGMTCWNVKTGHGFTVSKSSYETF
jgi:hypothetical protein